MFVYFAIAAPVLIGLAGASIDVGLWYANKRLTQSAVDSAALAGALELRRTDETDADAIHAFTCLVILLSLAERLKLTFPR